MTPQEIEQWARGANLHKRFAGKKVILKNPEGEYMAQQGRNWVWTRERADAFVWDWDQDHVLDQIKQVEDVMDRKLEPEQAPA